MGGRQKLQERKEYFPIADRKVPWTGLYIIIYNKGLQKKFEDPGTF